MPLNNLQEFAATKVVNGMGAFAGSLQTESVNTSDPEAYYYYNLYPGFNLIRDIKKNLIIKVWMGVGGQGWRLWNTYFVTRWGWKQDNDGGEVFSLGGYDQNHLLTRRVVAAYGGESESTMTDYADDMMKAVVTDSMEDDASPAPSAGTRAWGDLSVAGDVSAGPSITLEFAWKPLLTVSGSGVIPQIAKAARENGTDVFWSIVPNTISTSAITYQFRTYTGQPGNDLTSGQGKVLFSADDGTLANWELSYDYSEEVNYVWGFGQGDKSNQTVKQVYDADRYNQSYWGLCEGAVNARSSDDDDSAESEAYEALEEGRPDIKLSGKPIATWRQQFGKHYNVGDKVRAKAKGREFDAIVWSAAVGVNEDGETIEDVRLEYRE